MKIVARACIDKPIEEILKMKDVQERVEKYNEQKELFLEMLKAHARTEGNAIVVDMRNIETIYAGNRFLIYTLYPEQNISMWIIDGRNKQNCVITLGYSVINRSAAVNVGSLMLKYGGGGHKTVGTCQVPYAEADKIITDIVAEIK
jgi:nanoRNase/pAp phosphatase (c-di-AMP/oligoRNAs hydrolase)